MTDNESDPGPGPVGPADPAAKATAPAGRRPRPFWVEMPILVLIAIVLTFLVQTFAAKVYYVPSGSMEQTIYGATTGGDRILANKLVYDFRDPQSGDVVVFKGPDTWASEADLSGPTSWLGRLAAAAGSVVGIAPANEKDFVKRVIAVGGDTVACCDGAGNVTVNGTSLAEPYIYQPIGPFLPGVQDCTTGGDAERYGSPRCFAPVRVPAGDLWVMGDHRSDSDDSSFNCLGYRPTAAPPGCGRPIPAGDVLGKAIAVILPISRWHTIGNPR